MEIKKNIPNNTITRKLVDLDKDTGNIYETVNIIARRANQISTELKTEQLKFVRGAQSGTGILKHGNMVVPMDITVDKDSPIYKLFSTNPFEEERREAAHEEKH